MVPGHDRRRAAMRAPPFGERTQRLFAGAFGMTEDAADLDLDREIARGPHIGAAFGEQQIDFGGPAADALDPGERLARSEGHTYELPSLMRISYTVYCLKKTQE